MKDLYYFFFKCSLEFASETIQPGLFFVGRFVITTQFLVISLFRFSVSSWARFSNWLCKNLSISCKLSHFFGIMLLIAFPYNPFNFCRVGNDVSPFISDFANLCLLIVLVSLAKDLLILLIFSRRHLFHWFFSAFLVYYFIDFWIQSLFFPSFLL